MFLPILDESCLSPNSIEWNGNAQEPVRQIVFRNPGMAMISPIASPTVPHEKDGIGQSRSVSNGNQGMISRVAVAWNCFDDVVDRWEIELFCDPRREKSGLPRIESREDTGHVRGSRHHRMPEDGCRVLWRRLDR